jgi:hypothetical protein
VEEGALLQPAPHALAEAGHELVGVGRLQVADRVEAELGQALLGARPHALQQPAGSPAKRSQACSRERTTKPDGFSASLAVLATRRDGPRRPRS